MNESEIKYSDPIHNNVTPTLDFKAIDNLTNESDLRMCISEDTSTDNCSKNKNDIKKKQNGWVTYDKSKELSVMNNASNGENHNIFVSIGDQPSVTLPSISKAGYTCNWNTKSDGSGTKKNDGVSYIPNGNITFYARCSANTYKISYHGKSNDHGSMGDTNCTYDSNCKLRDNAFTKLGYTFLGWDTSFTATTVVYKNSVTVKNLTTSSSITLSAYGKMTVLSGTYETMNTQGHAVEVLGGTFVISGGTLKSSKTKESVLLVDSGIQIQRFLILR